MNIAFALPGMIRPIRPANQARSHANSEAREHFPGRGIVWASREPVASRSGPSASAYVPPRRDESTRPRATKVSTDGRLSTILRDYRQRAEVRGAYNAIVKDMFPASPHEQSAYLSTRAENPQGTRITSSLRCLRETLSGEVATLQGRLDAIQAAEQTILKERKELVDAYRKLPDPTIFHDARKPRKMTSNERKQQDEAHAAMVRVVTNSQRYQRNQGSYDGEAARLGAKQQLLARMDELLTRMEAPSALWAAGQGSPPFATTQRASQKVQAATNGIAPMGDEG